MLENNARARRNVGCVTRPTCLILTILGCLVLMGACFSAAIHG